MVTSKSIPEAPIPQSPSHKDSEFDAAAFEEANVHGVYSSIAPHFSSTRYKPWPLIPLFLSTLPPHSLGADVGTGNGKYLHLQSAFAPDAKEGSDDNVLIGVDRSRELLELALFNDGKTANPKGEEQLPKDAEPSSKTRMRNEVAVGDAIASGLRYGAFDFAISIATIHHLSTFERRRRSVEELIRLVKPVPASSVSVNPSPPPPTSTLASASTSSSTTTPKLSSGAGRFLIFVWALEQRDEGKRAFEASDEGGQDRSGRTTGEGSVGGNQEMKGRDLLVPWVFNEPGARKGNKPRGADRKERGSKAPPRESDGGPEKGADKEGQAKEDGKVYHRFYHVFAAGELEALVEAAAAHLVETQPAMAGVEVRREASGWERGNWWGVWQVVRRGSGEERGAH